MTKLFNFYFSLLSSPLLVLVIVLAGTGVPGGT